MSQKLEAARKKLTGEVMGRPGVTGTAVGLQGGKPCLKVFVSDDEAGKRVPKSVDGFRVVVEKSGTFRPTPA
ncbi:MAG TPA: hypothetical protein VGA70_06240 [Longimicrobiales bacterium]|jgi:hypothetical protein